MQLRRIIHKFATILPKQQKKQALGIMLMMIVGGVLEMCSVSIILPFVEAIMDPDRIMANPYVVKICSFFGIHSNRQFLIVLALVLAALYITKNCFLLLQMSVQNHYVRNNRFSVQRRLLQNYLSRPYEYFLGIDSGEVLRVIINDTTMTFGLMTTIMLFLSEMVVSFALILAVFVISPTITVAMGLMMFVLVTIIIQVLRPVLKKSTHEQQKSGAAMNQWLLQSIQGIKELKVMRREEFFLNEFTENGKGYTEALSRSATLSRIPRYLIETLSMSSFLVVIAIMIHHGTDLKSLVPILSVVAMAAIRLLPSVNRISQCMADMASNEPYLDKMLENLQEINSYVNEETVLDRPGAVRRMTDKVELVDVHYQYPSGESEVLTGASVSIHVGESVGIVGVSGAGKTTVVDILLGLLHPSKGQVQVDGTDIRLDMDGWLTQIGYIPQTIFILDGSIRENVAFGISPEEIDDDIVWAALNKAALTEFVESLSGKLDTQLGERGVRLSGGQRQRIGIARALYADPELLFFDEATSSLDNETEEEIMEAINNLHGHKTMIIIAHRLSTIQNCDHVFRVEDGKIKRER